MLEPGIGSKVHVAKYVVLKGLNTDLKGEITVSYHFYKPPAYLTDTVILYLLRYDSAEDVPENLYRFPDYNGTAYTTKVQTRCFDWKRFRESNKNEKKLWISGDIQDELFLFISGGADLDEVHFYSMDADHQRFYRDEIPDSSAPIIFNLTGHEEGLYHLLFFGKGFSKGIGVVRAKTLSDSAHSDIGNVIYGDFDGDGQTDLAQVVVTYDIPLGEESRVEPNVTVEFSSDHFGSIDLGNQRAILINEGDLNGDGVDDISIYQEPLHGCTYGMATYTFTEDSVWSTLVDYFLVPTACNPMLNEKLRERVFSENGVIYYLETDVDDPNWRLNRKRVR